MNKIKGKQIVRK